MEIIAAADGAALGNPGPTGWAWVIDEQNWQSGGMPYGTNNQGELLAVLRLLEATKHLHDAELTIVCDSRYVIDSLTQWLPGWKKRGWRKANGDPVLNLDLMQALDAALVGRNIKFAWVKGHSGHPLNEQADTLANGAARAYAAGNGTVTGPGLSL